MEFSFVEVSFFPSSPTAKGGSARASAEASKKKYHEPAGTRIKSKTPKKETVPTKNFRCCIGAIHEGLQGYQFVEYDNRQIRYETLVALALRRRTEMAAFGALSPPVAGWRPQGSRMDMERTAD